MEQNPDPRLVRLVARHFNDMQGLRRVLFGLCTLLVSVTYLATSDDTTAWIALACGVLATLAGMMALDRYYARQFGRVGDARRAWRTVAFGGTLGVLVTADQRLAGMPSVCWLAWSAWDAWLVWDCWPHRRHLLLDVAVGLYLSLTHMAVPGRLTTEMWIAQGFLLLSASVVITGIADHQLLARALRHGCAEDIALNPYETS